MARKSQKITVEGYVPNGSGGYTRVEDLSPEERKQFSQWMVDRMGHAFQDYFSTHPEEYAKF